MSIPNAFECSFDNKKNRRTPFNVFSLNSSNMPQEICVLCCFKCHIFQVDIVKKSKKWQCKMCGEKQSVLKVYFRGTGPECRLKVQDLNLSTNINKIKDDNELLNLLDRENLELDRDANVNDSQQLAHSMHTQNKLDNESENTESKWAKYLDKPDARCENFRGERLNNLKRKVFSNSKTIDGTKILKPSTSSKWSAYL